MAATLVNANVRRSPKRLSLSSLPTSQLTPSLAAGVETSLHELARQGRLDELRVLVKQHGASAVADDKGATLLYAAAEGNQVAVMKHVIESGVDCNAVDSEGNSALHIAVQNGSIEALHLLLNNGARDDVCNNCGDPPLHIAVRGTNYQLVSAILEHPINILVRGFRNCTTFHVIAEQDNVEALKIIADSHLHGNLFKENSFSAVNDDDTTPLHVAARKGSYQVLDFLLSKAVEHGYKPEAVTTFLDKEMITPLHFAVEGGSIEAVKILLKFGASPTLTRGVQLPPLHLAAFQGQVEIVEAMVQQYGPEILQFRDEEGRTAIHLAVTSISSKELLSFSSEHGGDLEAVSNSGFTPLHTAIYSGNLTAVKELLKRGCNPKAKDKKGSNALHLAVIYNRQAVVEHLLDHPSGCDLVSSVDGEGNCSIHLALTRGLGMFAIPQLQCLLRHNKDVNLKNKDGNNHLHLAAYAGDFPTVSNLLEFPFTQAMLNEPNKAGETVLHLAAAGGNVACVNALVNQGAIVHKCHCGRTPMMIACEFGNLMTTKALYNAYPFQKDWTDDKGFTALHYAAKGRNPLVIQFCLDIGIPITANNAGESFFDMILCNVDPPCAVTSLQHDRWQECLDYASAYSPHPILRLIERIPEAIPIVFHRSYKTCPLSREHPLYWEEFNFKYLQISPEEDNAQNEEEESSAHMDEEAKPKVSSELHSSVTLEMTELAVTGITQEASKQLILKHNTTRETEHHPAKRADQIFHKVRSRREPPLEVLRWMIKYKRTSFLVHPVVVAFLNTKWRDYARAIYVLPLILFSMLTVLLSVFISITPLPDNSASSGNGNKSRNTTDVDFGTASDVMRFFTLFFCILNTLLCPYLIYVIGRNAFNFRYNLWMWTYIATLLCTYVFLIPGSGLDSVIWEAGALAAFFAWFTVVVSLQLFGVIGIYVTMFLQITKNILILFVMALLFIFAFAFPLYALAGDLIEPLSTIGYSFFTVFASLIGDIKFETFVSLDASGLLRSGPLVFIFIVALTTMLPIIIINMLIGLAVGDIEQIRKNAVINRRAIEVELLSHIDGTVMPKKLLKRWERKSYKHYPNAPVSVVKTGWQMFWRVFKSDVGEYNGEECSIYIIVKTFGLLNLLRVV